MIVGDVAGALSPKCILGTIALAGIVSLSMDLYVAGALCFSSSLSVFPASLPI